MISYIINIFKNKNDLVKKVEELERKLESFEVESLQLDEALEEMRKTVHSRTEQVWATQRRFEDKVFELDILKTESRKLYYHTKEMISNAHLVPAGELEESLNTVERLTRVNKE